jgi:putative DNA primase/helicase
LAVGALEADRLCEGNAETERAMISTVERARGRWREILPQVGIGPQFLTGKHGPCPLCGGRDRFRFSDKDGDGWFYCNQCSRGPGIILVRKLKGLDHAGACRLVDDIIGKEYSPKPYKVPPKKNCNRAEANIRRLLDEARDPDIVARYLRGRGISAQSPTLLGHPRCPIYDGDHQLAGHHPAVVAPIVALDGSLQSAMRIYDKNPREKKTMPVVDSLNGAAARLFKPTEELGVAEGIETVLAAHELFNVPTWSALNANGVKTFRPPPGLLRLHIFGDHDANFVGQNAAYALAGRLHEEQPGLAIEVHIPPDVDTDWLDILKEGGQ